MLWGMGLEKGMRRLLFCSLSAVALWGLGDTNGLGCMRLRAGGCVSGRHRAGAVVLPQHRQDVHLVTPLCLWGRSPQEPG